MLVHSAALADLSESLKDSVNDFLDGRSTDWSDIDMKNFMQFCEFAYWGDYIPSKPWRVAESIQPPLLGQPNGLPSGVVPTISVFASQIQHACLSLTAQQVHKVATDQLSSQY
jgi:hypothetical protein